MPRGPCQPRAETPTAERFDEQPGPSSSPSAVSAAPWIDADLPLDVLEPLGVGRIVRPRGRGVNPGISYGANKSCALGAAPGTLNGTPTSGVRGRIAGSPGS